MALYNLSDKDLVKLEATTFSEEGIKEREDLQRILKSSIDIIAPGVFVIAEEFGEWAGSQRRIDLLAIDQEANLVVIELKRTQDGGHMELQALRYASMISNMTFKRATEVYADHFCEGDYTAAESAILKFLGWDEASESDFAGDVRIVLASGEFSRELTTSVLWLNEKGLDIQCVRMKPYRGDTGLLVNIERVIPLPEAEEFQIGVREKRQKQRIEKSTNRDTLRRDLRIGELEFSKLPKRRIIYEVVSSAIELGAEIEEIISGMPKGKWVSAPGQLDSIEFIDTVTADFEERGRSFNPRRYFSGDGELFHQNDTTYALSKQWGRGTQENVSRLEDRYGLDIEIDW